MDRPDLAPAARKRKPLPAAPEPVAAPQAPAANLDLTGHVHAIESAIRSLDARVELLERLVRDAAARSLAVAQATDEALARVNDALARMDVSDLRDDVHLVAERLATLLGGPSLTELMDRIDEIGGRADPGAESKVRRRTRRE